MTRHYCALPGTVIAKRVLSAVALLVLGVVLAGTPDRTASAETPSVVGIRVGDHGATTRIVLDLTAAPTFRIEAAPDGRSVGVVLPHVLWSVPSNRLPSALGPITAYAVEQGGAAGDTRLTLSMNRPVRVIDARPLKPDREYRTHRIVVDIAPLPASATAAPAPTGVPASDGAPAQSGAAAKPPAPSHGEQELDQGIQAIAGTKGKPDFASAFRWFQKAAALGNASAAYNIGELYQSGKGVTQDYVAAASWYDKASQANFPPAQLRLGILLYDGIGVAQDRTRALDLLEKAAAQDFAPAQFHLGILLYDGVGIPPDRARAIELLNMAAAHDYARAKEALAKIEGHP